MTNDPKIDAMMDRLMEVEMTIAHQEKTIADLSDVATSQWNEIAELKRKLIKANDKIEALESPVTTEDQANVKPPHW